MNTPTTGSEFRVYLEGLQNVFTLVPVVRCKDCGYSFAPMGNPAICPSCGEEVGFW